MNRSASHSSLKDVSVKAAGAGYLIGDAAIVARGLLTRTKVGTRDYSLAATGAAWGLGGLFAARYGNPKAEVQFRLLNKKLDEFLNEKGISIPENATAETLNGRGGIIQAIEDFFYQHPTDMLNLTYLLGSGTLIYSGAKDKNNHADLASGILVAAGSLAGLLIREKKPDLQNPAQGLFGKASQWAHAKPPRVASAFYLANNVSTVTGAVSAYRQQEPTYWLRALTAISYIFANCMLFISPQKNVVRERDKDELTHQLAERAGQVIAAQPKEVQAALLQEISSYLAPQMKQQPEALYVMLQDRLGEISKGGSPAKHGKNNGSGAYWQASIAATPSASPTRA